MKTSKIVGAVVTVVFCSSVLAGQGQYVPPPDITDRQIKGSKLNQATIVNAATSAFNAASVPGGIASKSPCGSEEIYNLTPVGHTLRDVLGSIVIAEPKYRWYVDHDVVNLIESSGEPTLLDVVISEFNLEQAKTVDEVVEGLLKMPDVKKGIIELQLTRMPVEIGLRSLERPGSPKAKETDGPTIHQQNVTVRDALNAIARAHGSAVWRYNERNCKSAKEFSLGFLVW